MKPSKNNMQLLDEAIMQLEEKRHRDFEALKMQFYQTSDSFKPINIFNQAVKDFRKLPEVKTNLIETMLSIFGGYLSKRMLLGKTNSITKKILGYVLQYTVTNFISKKVSNEKKSN